LHNSSTIPALVDKGAENLLQAQELNKALVKRNALPRWFEDAQFERWPQQERSDYRSRAMRDSGGAIQCGLTIRKLFQLPLRLTEGFLRSLVSLLGVALQAPAYSTLCRRQQTLAVTLSRPVNPGPSAFGRGCDGIESLWRRRRESTAAGHRQTPDLEQATLGGR
jgi:hypothetical protein